MNKNNANKKIEQRLENILITMWKLTIILFQLMKYGIKQINFSSIEFKIYGSCILGFVFGLTYKHRYIYWLEDTLSKSFFYGLISSLYAIPWTFHYIFALLVMIFLVLILIGLRPCMEMKRVQKKLDEVNLKSGQGTPPRVVLIQKPEKFKTRIVIRSKGVDLADYQSKKGALSTSFNAIVESIKKGASPQFVEISLTQKVLPKTVSFTSLMGHLRKPYSLIIGEALGGVVTLDISTLPHMLIAGSTGGGKSVFFKQALLGLLHSSEWVQMYLLDLKGGVEMKEFNQLPNVRVIKTEEEAVRILTQIRDEMKRRFTFLEKSGHKNIVSKRDQMDKIIIGIDEASELYTRVSSQNSKHKLIAQARELTDELAKLARAAGIHLIFATQKINKDTMDPKVQENIGGRVCFRTNTLENSIRAIGNKKAFELPDIKGRAIWATGNTFTEIQAPFISDEELKEAILSLQNKYKQKEKAQQKIIWGKMIGDGARKKRSKDDLATISQRPIETTPKAHSPRKKVTE